MIQRKSFFYGNLGRMKEGRNDAHLFSKYKIDKANGWRERKLVGGNAIEQ